MAKICNIEELRRYINNSEEIMFAEQFKQEDLSVAEPIIKYMGDARGRSGLTHKQINKLLGVVSLSPHLFSIAQWMLPTKDHYNKLREHMDSKPYEEIKQEYGTLCITYNLTADRPYSNTWTFKSTPARKGRHPCEKPE